MLRFENVSLRYPGAAVDVLSDVTFALPDGEIFALLGPSGSGKTTTLRALAGFEPITAGRILLDGAVIQTPDHSMPTEERGIGFVFQEHALFPHLTVRRNIEFGVERGADVTPMLELLEIGPLADRMPHALSGGERQRVALARALAPNPSLLLMDEPFASLDKGLREAVRRRVADYLRERHMTVLVVTHDQEEALSFAHRLAVMRNGKIEQLGAPEQIYTCPATRFVATFLGDTNFVTGDADGVCARTAIGDVRLDRSAEGPVTLSLRPEHIELSEPGPGEIVSREFKGHDITLRVRYGEQMFVVQTDYRCPLGVGAHVRLIAREPAVVLTR